MKPNYKTLILIQDKAPSLPEMGVPEGVWLVSTEELTEADIEWAHKFITEHGES